jgi:endonuclease/exonuclease/phosphatase family metal-dependent hydrolase
MSEPQLRIMTYNVRSLRDDVAALTAIVRAQAPDVLLVQEAPRFLRWRSKRAALARRCGLVVATTDRPGGLCIMTSLRVTVRSTSFHLLPKTPGRHQRAMVAATVSVGGAAWRVASVHLSTDGAERQAHLPDLYAALDSESHGDSDDGSVPLVVGGDINEGPADPVFTQLADRWVDSFAVGGTGTGLTSPAASPGRRLDAIFADRSMTVVSCEAVKDRRLAAASDHVPVVAVLAQPSP